ncbi:CDG_1a_G0005560.mRNA.1.CDS.1 [Saccharomyces cerevisiae]|nr:CDG_1a_G0005560.mRNA.1.CDS.1 [Saccharomyces cerevisiae]CAI7168137.1 CDG_1a_G0005560.mRNA.1.CDS.1 [Saccharomyces cerevisiae]
MIVHNTKKLKESRIMDNFLEHLSKDDNKAWYGAEETERAAKLDAIETLLIADSVLKRNDVKKREKYLDLIENSGNNNGKIFVLSTSKITVSNLTNQQI